MPKSAQEYRQEAHRVREMAMAMAMETPAPEIQAALLEVAANYDGLAYAAETLTALDSSEFSS